MMKIARHSAALGRFALIVAATTSLIACGGQRDTTPPGMAPDEYLFTRGQAEMADKDWLNARTYFQQIVDNYPQSPRRPEAKLALGDSFLGEDTPESLVFAANEFREFLQYFPVHARADYAQYRLGLSHFQQMRAADRDQTETRDALREFDFFFERYPNSPLTPEVRQKWREARDRLSEASFLVGRHYFRQRWYPGGIDRFKEVLKEDPQYTGRDAVYYYLAESLYLTGQKPEALPYFERLLSEFTTSEYLEPARKRVQELKTQ